jgi:hypothetical protein
MEGTSVEYVLARPGGKFTYKMIYFIKIKALIPEKPCNFGIFK